MLEKLTREVRDKEGDGGEGGGAKLRRAEMADARESGAVSATSRRRLRFV